MFNRMYINLEEGKKACMPRYYKDRIYDKEMRERIGVVLRSKMLDEQKKAIDEYGPMYHRDNAEAAKAAFVKMKLDFLNGQKL